LHHFPLIFAYFQRAIFPFTILACLPIKAKTAAVEFIFELWSSNATCDRLVHIKFQSIQLSCSALAVVSLHWCWHLSVDDCVHGVWSL